MSDSFETLYQQVLYLFSHITPIDVLDIALVAGLFFVAFQVLYQTRALQMLRGVILIAVLGGALLVLLPLDTLSRLVTIILIAGVIAMPILFQDELRRILTGIGRIGRRQRYASDFERFKAAIIKTVFDLADKTEGALIVLEGETPMDDIVSTGISMGVDVVSSELLETIFMDKTPLHDGAVIIRGDRLLAASCILPLQTERTGDVHLGTRHRAALGLSSRYPDAMVVVVSEETKRVSIAYTGNLYYGLSRAELDEKLSGFGAQFSNDIQQRWRWLRGGGLKPSLINLLMAVILAVFAWVIVAFQINPPTEVTIESIPLSVAGPDSGMLIMSELPESVKIRIQTTKDQAASIDPSTLRADVDLSGIPSGVTNVLIKAYATEPEAQVLSVKPASIDIQLEPKIRSILTPTIEISDFVELLPGLVIGEMSMNPAAIEISGPQSEVEKVRQARLPVSINNRTADFQVTANAMLLDENNHEIQGLEMLPNQFVVTVPLKQTFLTRPVGIQADVVREGLDADYEITTIEITPTRVTLAGSNTELQNAGDFIVTAPISLTGVYSDLLVEAPLVLPEGILALNDQGGNLSSAQVKVSISPVMDYLVLEERVVVTNLPLTLTAQVAPAQVSVLLVGPRPLLGQIAVNQEMVVVSVDVSGQNVGVHTIPLEVQLPSGVKVQLFPPEVEVVIKK